MCPGPAPVLPSALPLRLPLTSCPAPIPTPDTHPCLPLQDGHLAADVIRQDTEALLEQLLEAKSK